MKNNHHQNITPLLTQEDKKMNTARQARKSPVAHGARVTVNKLKYVTLRIAQPEQYVNDFVGTFWYVEVGQHG